VKYRSVLYIILGLLALWTLLPPLLTLETSFLPTYAFVNPLRAIKGMSLANWQYLPYDRIIKWSLNSLVVCGVSTVVGTLVCSLAGFGFAKYEFPLKDSLFMLFLLAMMIPPTLLFLPRFLIIRNMGLLDTHLGMIAPMLIYPAGVFFARQYISKLPDELVEAARMDGASDWQVFRYVIFPLSLPLVAVLSLFIFVFTWQQYMWQLIIARSEDVVTLIVGLGSLLRGLAGGGTYAGLSEHSAVSIEGLQAAASVIIAIPTLLVYLLLLGRDAALEGLTMGGVKG
jgi:multiple sugar transport system permease protein